MKKIIAVILMLALSLTMCISVSAEEVTSVDKIGYLVSKGIPEDMLNNFPPTQIDRMYETFTTEAAEYLGTEIVTMQDTGAIDMYGTIPSSDMHFYISTALVRENNSIMNTAPVKHLQVFVTYTWEPGHPLVHWKDGITVNWDPSVFTFLPGSFSGTESHRIMGVVVNTREFKDLAASELGGIGYTADLFSIIAGIANNQQWLATCYGDASFKLVPAKNPMYIDNNSNFPNTTNIVANYLHNKNPAGFSVGFNVVGVQVVANVGGLSDSVGATTWAKYKY